MTLVWQGDLKTDQHVGHGASLVPGPAHTSAAAGVNLISGSCLAVVMLGARKLSQKSTQPHRNTTYTMEAIGDDCTVPLTVSDGHTHLFILLHGVMGNASHMSELSKEIQAVHGESALLYSASCYSGFKSLRGTQYAGEKVFSEIKILINENKKTLNKVSLLGYSFGGMVATWVAGRLIQEKFMGLTPMNFVTIGCPHLGAVPPHGGGCFVRFRRFLMQTVGRATGEELSLSDAGQLLAWMSEPSSPFHAALRSFRRRALYANLRGDRTVPFHTAYFPAEDDPVSEAVPGCWDPAGPDFPHVLLPATAGAAARLDPAAADMPLRVRIALALLAPFVISWFLFVWSLLLLPVAGLALARFCRRRPAGAAAAALPAGLGPPPGAPPPPLAAEAAARIARGLNALAWDKHGVLFSWRRDGVCAARSHGHIVVRRPLSYAGGADVLRHIVQHLAP
jgi:hypothetical protein